MYQKILMWVLIVCATFPACKESITGPPGISTNLITNPSFERNGNPSLEGWTMDYYDTSLVRFASDVPQNGGSYSLSIQNLWGPPPYLRASFPISPGVHRYRFSGWSKAISPGQPYLAAVGGMEIRHKTTDSLFHLKWLTFADSVWAQHTLIDTIAAQQGDTIIVSLHVGGTQWNWGFTLFDLIELIQLD